MLDLNENELSVFLPKSETFPRCQLGSSIRKGSKSETLRTSNATRHTVSQRFYRLPPTMLGSKINKRKAEEEIPSLAAKTARAQAVPLSPSGPFYNRTSLPTPEGIRSSSSTWLQAPLSTDQDEEERALEALEASTILRSFTTGARGTKLERKSINQSSSVIPAPLSLHLPFPNPKWRMPFDSPDSSLPSFLIPSPRSSSTSRSDSSDISTSCPIPCKALSALLSKEANGLISSLYARSVAIKAKQNRAGNGYI